MAYLAVNKDGLELVFPVKPVKNEFDEWCSFENSIDLPTGTIKKIIGRDLTWDDDPVQLE